MFEKQKLFEFTVKDIFNFQDGRTLFSGELKEHADNLAPCKGEIQIDNTLFKVIDIEATWVTGEKGIENPLFKILSTTETIPKKDLLYEEGRVRIIGYR